jgi:hypothetical protein
MRVHSDIVFVHAVKVLLCSLLAVALDGGTWLDSHRRRVGGLRDVFIVFVERINLVSVPGIEPQFLRSPPLA